MALVDELDAALRAGGTAARAEGSKAYLKSELEFYGTTMPALHRAVKAGLRARPALDRAALWKAVDALWARPVFERRAAAVELLAARVELLAVGDLKRIEAMLRDSHTWALVDAIAPRVVGGLVARFGAPVEQALDRWARDDDFWIRRAALLALLLPLRAGGGDFARFGRYADAMLEEKEFFIRKAIGWLLREASKQDPARVTAWLTPRAARASGVTVREAVKYLPAKDREAILKAFARR
jgi:3-methyladenine DNA glycosylase AlkD